MGSGSDGSGTDQPRRPGKVNRAKARLKKMFSRRITPTPSLVGLSAAPMTPTIISHPTVSGTQAPSAIASVLGNFNQILIPGPIRPIDLTVTQASVLNPVPASVSLDHTTDIVTPLPGPTLTGGPASKPDSISPSTLAPIAKPGGADTSPTGNTVLRNNVSAPSPVIANTLPR